MKTRIQLVNYEKNEFICHFSDQDSGLINSIGIEESASGVKCLRVGDVFELDNISYKIVDISVYLHSELKVANLSVEVITNIEVEQLS